MGTFEIDGDDFTLDGHPFRVLSGAIHYFRVHPEQWADRIHKAKLMGLNTIETYVPWNLHAPTPNEWCESGPLDLARFLDTIAAEGMRAIVRPGPYICAEWDNGGLPAWLFTNPLVGIRRREPLFMRAVAEYLARVYAIVAPRQIAHDGPVILVQIENEYGAYGRDKDYLLELVDLTRRAGITVPLTTVDQPQPAMLENGSLPELHKTGSFGSRSLERLATLRRHQPTGPLMCSEYWDGWFDQWGEHHHTTNVEDAAADLDALLSTGASVNLYMFHGGTNFGFTNGANDKGTYRAIVTSYDYDAPLDEAGEPTAKYWAFREVLARHTKIPDETPRPAPAAAALTVELAESVPLEPIVERLGDWTSRHELPTLDSVGHFSGFALYRTEVTLEKPAVFALGEVRDRATVFIDGARIGVLARDHHDTAITLPAAHGSLTVLLEDQGRVDYGPRIGEPKGLIGPATMGGVPLEGWHILPIDLRSIDAVRTALDELATPSNAPAGLAGPVFARGRFSLEAVTDLFLDTTAWGKGVVWVNGACLGRYWSRGPQQTLYVPAPLVREEDNEIVVFEVESAARATATFVERPRLGHTEN